MALISKLHKFLIWYGPIGVNEHPKYMARVSNMAEWQEVYFKQHKRSPWGSLHDYCMDRRRRKEKNNIGACNYTMNGSLFFCTLIMF